MQDPVDPSTVAHAPGVRVLASSFEVRVTAGPDTGKSIAVTPRSPGRVLVGTSATCALRLTDRRVSRRHLALDAKDGRLRVTDLGSTNGTTANGLAVGDAFCRGGELVVIGDTTLRIDIDRDDVETPDVRMAFGSLIGASLAMRRLYRTCDALAMARSPLVIEGEPGSGKMTLADALHASSGAAEQPFVVVAGASLDARTMAADADSLLDEASGGTLVVHEIGEVPYDAQSALAALVVRAEARDVRFVATTCKNLEAAIEASTFAEELVRELSSRIELPPLRERRGDIGLLVEHFARRLGRTSAAIPAKKLGALNRHDFSGNVRELERMVALLLADASAPIASGAAAPEAAALATADLELDFRDIVLANEPFAEAKQRVLERFAHAYVVYAVAAHGGLVARAAAASGLAPRYFNILRARSRRKAEERR